MYKSSAFCDEFLNCASIPIVPHYSMQIGLKDIEPAIIRHIYAVFNILGCPLCIYQDDAEQGDPSISYPTTRPNVFENRS